MPNYVRRALSWTGEKSFPKLSTKAISASRTWTLTVISRLITTFENFAVTRPDRVYAERFNSFRSPFVGAPLFQRLGVGEAQLAHLQARAAAVGAPNQRADLVEVEAKYCFNELGIKNDADMEAKHIAFQRLLATRLKNLKKDMARAEIELAAKFKDTAFF